MSRTPSSSEEKEATAPEDFRSSSTTKPRSLISSSSDFGRDDDDQDNLRFSPSPPPLESSQSQSVAVRVRPVAIRFIFSAAICLISPACWLWSFRSARVVVGHKKKTSSQRTDRTGASSRAWKGDERTGEIDRAGFWTDDRCSWSIKVIFDTESTTPRHDDDHRRTDQ